MENVKVEVTKHKNNIDFSVKVTKPNSAPQIFNNLPVINCLINCGCSEEQIKNAEITKD